MRRRVAVFALGIVVMLFVSPIGGIAAQTPHECGDLGFNILESAVWRIAAGENFQPIAKLNEPALYEICRSNSLFPPKVLISTDSGFHVHEKLPIGSCVLIFSKRIGIWSEKKVGPNDIVDGTYRRFDGAEEPTLTNMLHFQAQADASAGIIQKFAVAAMTGCVPPNRRIDQKAIYRFCQGQRAPEGDYSNHLPGLHIWRGASPITIYPARRSNPVDDLAIFGPASCVDFYSDDVRVEMRFSDRAKNTYLACGKVAFGLNERKDGTPIPCGSER